MFDTKEKEELKAKSLGVALKMRTVHAYGCKAILARRDKFFKKGQEKVKVFHKDYVPNPYMFQYDLEMEIFLEWDEITKEAIALAETKEEKDHIKEFGPTGLARHEHLFIAAEIRWPIKKENGVWDSGLVPHPWIERQWESLCDYKFLIVFGGGGQGKTHGFAAFMCMIYDHYICTNIGAKCCFSTVNEGKLKAVIWPYVSQRLYPVDEDRDNFSLYAGRGTVAGDYTIKRFGEKAKDTGAVMQGILVGDSVQDAAIEDKLTGTHGYIAYFYLLDEMQSTKEAPLKAAMNFMSVTRHSWVAGAGNYDKDSDLLGDNSMPIDGWASVDENTGEWESMNSLGHYTRVIHQHNDRSPAMTDPKWRKRCTNPITGKCFLPDQERKDRLYPTPQSKKTNGYRRYWKGFRNLVDTLDLILSPKTIEDNNLGAMPDWDHTKPINHHLSVDPAQAEGDRNAVMHFMDGYCMRSGIWCWAPVELTSIPKATNSDRYYREASQWIKQYCMRNGIPSGNAIIDWTSKSSIKEYLKAMGFIIHALEYGKACPDGKTKDKRTGIKGERILLEPDPTNFENSKFGHTECESMSALGAWALLQFTIFGRVRNIGPHLLEPLKAMNMSKDIDKELYSREYETRVTQAYGERFAVKSKKEFVAKFHFSPDLFDLFLQAAFYMVVHRNMLPSGIDFVPEVIKEDAENDFEAYLRGENPADQSNSIWSHDLLPDY